MQSASPLRLGLCRWEMAAWHSPTSNSEFFQLRQPILAVWNKRKTLGSQVIGSLFVVGGRVPDHQCANIDDIVQYPKAVSKFHPLR